MFAATVLRSLMVGSVLGFSGIACTCIVVKIATPLSDMRVQRAEIVRLEARKKQLAAECVEKERMEIYLPTREGKEMQVRQLGWIKPGERPLRLKNDSLTTENKPRGTERSAGPR